MNKKFLGYVITDIGYYDNHIYEYYEYQNGSPLYIPVNDHIEVPEEIYEYEHKLYNEFDIRNISAQLENKHKLNNGIGVCSRCIMTFYSNNN